MPTPARLAPAFQAARPSVPPKKAAVAAPGAPAVRRAAPDAFTATSADARAYEALQAALGPAGQAHLASLRASGALARPDAHGRSLLANLTVLAKLAPPAGAPYTAGEILAQAIAHVADPAVIAQGNRNTCGATTVQYVLATEQPAEYVRLVAGLAGAGKATLRGGQAMALPADGVPRDDTSRDDVERLVQTAFQNYGGDFRGTYSNATDRTTHAENAGGGLKGFLRRTLGRAVDWGVGLVEGGVGVSAGKLAELYADTTGRPARLVGDLPGGVFLAPGFVRGDVWAAVAKAAGAGRAVPVDLVLEGLEDTPGAQDDTPFRQALGNYPTQMRSHMVLVTKIEAGRVHYRNPWGYETSLSEAAFRSRLTDAIIPG